MNLDVSKPRPSSITVELEGDAVVDVEVFFIRALDLDDWASFVKGRSQNNLD